MLRVALVFVLTLVGAAAPKPGLDTILGIVSTYLVEYEHSMSAAVADEEYVQKYDHVLVPPSRITTKRSLKSDFAFLVVPGDLTWTGFRDTFSVDGKRVRDRDARLQSLLSTSGADARRRMKRIDEANARFNLGEFPRSVNVPTIALGLIHPKHRERFDIRVAGRDKIDRRELWMLEYRELGRPTLIRTREGENQPAKVTVWVDGTSGAIHKTVLDLGGDRVSGYVTTKITVQYDRDDHLAMLVPRTMVESYYGAPDGDVDSFGIYGTATYSNYRRFETSGRIVD